MAVLETQLREKAASTPIDEGRNRRLEDGLKADAERLGLTLEDYARLIRRRQKSLHALD
jgi:hypothetical protein